MRVLLCSLVAVALFAKTKYTGPAPAKKDVPYLLHADNLLETEVTKATPQDKKDETLYTTPGESSPVKTPLASPIFIIDASQIVPDKLQLFKLDVKNGHREITFKKKGHSANEPIAMTVTNVGGTLFRLEVVNDVPNGEYALTPDGTNDVFCFSVY